MHKLDTQKEKNQIVNIIKITSAITSLLLLCAGLMNSSNQVEENVLKYNIQPIVKLDNFKVQVTDLNNLVYKVRSVGKSYELLLTKESDFVEVKIYQLDDMALYDLMFEKAVEETYTRLKRVSSNCVGDCYMPKVRYEEAMKSLYHETTELWNADEAYTYMEDNNPLSYDRHQMFVIKQDNKILTLRISIHDLSLTTPFIHELADKFNQIDLNQL